MADFVNTKITTQDAEALLVIEETTAGVTEKITGSEVIGIIADSNLGQDRERVIDRQRAQSLDPQEPIPTRLLAGTAELACYIKSPALGSVPECDPLLAGLFGQDATIVGGTSAIYNQAAIGVVPKSFSVWLYRDFSVEVLSGFYVDKGSIRYVTTGDDSVLGGTFSGFGASLARAVEAKVTEDIDGDPTPDTTIVVDDARKFQVPSAANGPFIVLKHSGGTLDNSGAGYQVTAVNYTTNTLTISPGMAGDFSVADDLYVAPWQPTLSALSGDFVYGGKGASTWNAIDPLPIYNFNAEIAQNLKLITDVQRETDALDADFILRRRRDQTGSCEILMTPQTSALIRHGYEGTKAALLVQALTEAGTKAVEIACPKWAWDPSVRPSGDEERRYPMTGRAYKNSGNDAIQLAFRAPS